MKHLTVLGLAAVLASPALAQHAPEAHGHHGVSPEASATGALAPVPHAHGGHGVLLQVARTASARQSRRVRARRAAFNHRRMSERQGFKQVSSLVNFPSFFPGIGALYVKPDTLPNGPFRAYDRQDRLVSTIYMIPIDDIEQKKTFDLAGVAGRGDHVTMYFNGGHPGVDMPHYHVVVWHVSKKEEVRVAK